MHRRAAVVFFTLAALVGGSGCGGGGAEQGVEEPMTLGPIDGHDLPATDLDRVKDGEPAPDFALASYAGPVVRLSDLRGKKNVVLVFYRGHW